MCSCVCVCVYVCVRVYVCVSKVQLAVLRHLLASSDVSITRHGALTVNMPSDAVDEQALASRAVFHEVLLVEYRRSRETFLVDVGYGPNALAGPLPFSACMDGHPVQLVSLS